MPARLPLFTAVLLLVAGSDCFAFGKRRAELRVEVSGAAVIKQEIRWSIRKEPERNRIELEPGQQKTLLYSIVASPKTVTPERFMFRGRIRVQNPGKKALSVPTPRVLALPNHPAELDCAGAQFPNVLPAGRYLECSFSVELPDSAERALVVTGLSEKEKAGKDPVASSTINFSDATTEASDRCIEIQDSDAGSFGRFCLPIESPVLSFKYSRKIGPFTGCGDYVIKSSTSFRSVDSGASGRDSCKVQVRVLCDGEKLTGSRSDI